MPKRKSKYGKPKPTGLSVDGYRSSDMTRQGGQPSLIKMAHKKGALYLPK